jgi:hypothetical protein
MIVESAFRRRAEMFRRSSTVTVAEFVKRGQAAQQAVDAILSAERSKHLQGKRGLTPFSGVGACVMFSSLVAPHGSTSHSENMNMNAFKKTLVAIAAVATLGATGLVSTQASAGWRPTCYRKLPRLAIR